MIINYMRSIKHFFYNIIDIFFRQKKIDDIDENDAVFVMLAADYSNLGDVAITYSQVEFLKKIYPNRKIIEVDVADTCKVYLDMKRKISQKTIITIIGGGNTGDKYELLERYRRFIIRRFKNYRVISFPQTVEFSNNKYGKYSLKRSILSYSKNKELLICAREEKSYNFYKNNFKNKNIILVPDIVLTQKVDYKGERQGICFLMRNDKEKKITYQEQKKLFDSVKIRYTNIEYRDTCIKNFKMEKKYIQLHELISIIKTKKLIITDRLHGMILSYITSTPCLVFQNNNHKIEGIYKKWICKCNFIILVKNFDIEIILEKIERLYNTGKREIDKDLMNEFKILIDRLPYKGE